MKKAIPLPAIIGAVCVALATIGFIFAKSGQTQEFKAPDTPKVIPAYVAEKMDPKTLDQMKKDGYKVEDVAPTAPSGGTSGSAGPTMPTGVPQGANLGSGN